MKGGFVCALLALLAVVSGQQVGTLQTETHPSLPLQECTKASGCSSKQTSIVLDANWRWLHKVGDSSNCYTGNSWDASKCSDGVTCATGCALEGADYPNTYGITAGNNGVSLRFVTKHAYGTNIGSRVYLLESDTKYKLFKLKNREFSFTVDVSKLPCGLNGAVYFVEMPQDGGSGAYANNKAGAKFGTGYCDAQCPHDVKFINGEANVINWTPSSSDPNSGKGQYGACCSEMDIWEANSISSAYTPHPCNTQGLYRCKGTECGDPGSRYAGVCDKDGCDFQSYRLGNKAYLGPGSNFTVDTTKPITVLTRFITKDGTDTGALSEIKQLFLQNGKLLKSATVNVPGVNNYDSITDAFCSSVKSVFGDYDDFTSNGGLKAMGDSFDRGMVLVMSLWDDHDAHMLWLDSNYPTEKDPSQPGVARGTCPTTSGVPKDVEAAAPGATVVYSDLKFGEIGSTNSIPSNEVITLVTPVNGAKISSTTQFSFKGVSASSKYWVYYSGSASWQWVECSAGSQCNFSPSSGYLSSGYGYWIVIGLTSSGYTDWSAWGLYQL